jgi:hypothetical protein
MDRSGGKKMGKSEGLGKKLESLSFERKRVAKIFKSHIEKAIIELGSGYIVDLQGNFFDTPIRITIEISPINKDS